MKMSTPSRSRSSAMGDEGYFNWRESMERRKRESERQALLTTGNRGTNERTLGRTRKPHILETQSPSLTRPVCGLMKDPCHPIMHHKMKARTPLIPHQRGDVVGSPSCLT
ncbi:hypothetical protein CK203_029646 [Vitis vinifera]|uniref:Uncharacterized protein n=1 Tax=Vitis vinifera TaxID=29760 RepID=A0A438III2_VITVI|nr:hypothetical protein CK203_029646 [Vitis vinifera]